MRSPPCSAAPVSRSTAAARPTSTDVTPYAAVILGSGMFVPSRRSDGGGFLARHAAVLAARPVWLFCAGPIGRGRCPAGRAASAAE